MPRPSDPRRAARRRPALQTSQLAGRVPFVTVVGNETHAKGTAAAAAAGAGGGVVVTADWVQACVNSGERLGWERFMQRAVEGEAEEVRAAARREEEAAAQKELQRLAATQSGAASSEEMAFAMIMRLLKLQRPYPPRGPRSRMLRAWVGAGGGAAKEGAGGGAARSEGGAGAFRFVTWNILMTESFGGSESRPPGRSCCRLSVLRGRVAAASGSTAAPVPQRFLPCARCSMPSGCRLSQRH